MELEGEDGSKLPLKKGLKVILGRGLGCQTGDRTVSRRHVSIEVTNSNEIQTDHITVLFEVVGKNPVWLLRKVSGEIAICRKFEKGELGFGDLLCLSGKNPVWFGLKENEDPDFESKSESELDGISGNGVGFEGFDASGIDPVKEFGFLVIGHEFDSYPKNMIRDANNWEWFLEDPRKDDEDNDDEELSKKKERRSTMRKRKKVEADEDDDWTDKSEDDEETIAKLRKGIRPKYSTRSRDHDRTSDTRQNKNSTSKKTIALSEDDEDTLGGFIVTDDDMEQEEEEEESNADEEEDFVEDDEEED